jgi:hypothetical protein
MSVVIEKKLAKALQNVDWSEIVLGICGAKNWRMGSLARHLNCNSAHLGRLSRYEVAEPRVTLAIRLLDMYAEVVEGKQ